MAKVLMIHGSLIKNEHYPFKCDNTYCNIIDKWIPSIYIYVGVCVRVYVYVWLRVIACVCVCACVRACVRVFSIPPSDFIKQILMIYRIYDRAFKNHGLTFIEVNVYYLVKLFYVILLTYLITNIINKLTLRKYLHTI